jgi:hypothetical protein
MMIKIVIEKQLLNTYFALINIQSNYQAELTYWLQQKPLLTLLTRSLKLILYLSHIPSKSKLTPQFYKEENNSFIMSNLVFADKKFPSLQWINIWLHRSRYLCFWGEVIHVPLYIAISSVFTDFIWISYHEHVV